MSLERWLLVARLRLRSLLRRARVEAELRDEMQFHLDERARELEARGLSTEHARDAALSHFGGVEQRKEECRDARRVALIEDLVKDTGYALRVMRRAPGFATVAVLSLAVGIGANTAIFTVFDALVLKPLPVDRPDQLRTTRSIVRLDGRGVKEADSLPYPLFRDLESDRTLFSEILAFSRLDEPVVLDGGRTLRTPGGGLAVSANYFAMLGIAPGVGRLFAPDDGSAIDRAVVLSDPFWRREFGADPTVIGKPVTVNGMAFSVLGVAPPGFFGLSIGRTPDFFTTIVPTQGMNFPVQIVGRLQTDATDAMASQTLTTALHARLGGKPSMPAPIIEMRPADTGLSDVRQRFAEPLAILMVMVSTLLLIAAANVASMLLSRASARKTEMVIRSSMGAGSARLLRQLATESLLLVALGAGAGLVLASSSTRALTGLMQYLDPSLSIDLAIDARVLAFIGVLSGMAALVSGLAPALHTIRRDTSVALRDRRDSRTPSSTGRATRPFVVAQVALSLALVAAAGLLARTLHSLTTIDAGFRPDGVLLVGVNPGARGYQRAELATYFTTLSDRLRALPGVERVSLMQFSFLTSSRTTGTLAVPGFVPATADERWIQVFQVGPGFFAAMGIPLVEGRDFTDQDMAAEPSPMALNQAAARRYFGSDNAIGRTINGDQGRQHRVIAVVRNGRYNTLREQTDAVSFVPYASAGRNRMTYVVKMAGSGAPALSLPRLIDQARDVDPLVPVEGTTLNAIVGHSVGQERLLTIIAGFFGVTALLLMALGLYGMMAYWVVSRTSEIGVRLALGAPRLQVVWDVVRRPLTLVALGLLIGIGITIGGGRFASNVLFDLAPQDPLTLSAAVVFLLVVAATAGAFPARRACRIDPIAALRCE